jgi:hypothetical protein
MQEADQKKLSEQDPFTDEEIAKAVAETRLAEVEEPKNKFIVKSVEDMSELVGMPLPFIQLLNGKPYVTKQGLYWKAEKKGYRSLRTVFLERDTENEDYLVEARLYPHLTKEDYILLGMLQDSNSELYEKTFKEITRPYVVQRRTNRKNVPMKQIHPHMEALAQTRAINEVLRLFTGCGFRPDDDNGVVR